jgi:hypothetical protein
MNDKQRFNQVAKLNCPQLDKKMTTAFGTQHNIARILPARDYIPTLSNSLPGWQLPLPQISG